MGTIDRVRQRLVSELASPHAIVSQPPATSQRRWLQGMVAVAAVTLMIASLASVMISSGNAMAQIAAAIEQRPWMRLTLKKPVEDDIDAAQQHEPFPKVVMWFSGNRRIAAADKPDEVRWLDTVKDEQQTFRRDSTGIHRGKIDSDGRSFVTVVSHLLEFLQAPKAANAPARLVAEDRRAITIDGVSFDEFVFDFEFEVPAKFRARFEIRVDPEYTSTDSNVTTAQR